MELSEVRKEIDLIDDEIASLYEKRMGLVKEVIDAKKQTGKAVTDMDRERNILVRVSEKVSEQNKVGLKRLFECIFNESKAYQTMSMDNSAIIVERIKEALSKGEKILPACAKVACQGVNGAYSGIATDRLFEIADITYFKNFEGVFQAVEKGFCNYGVLPIENSSAGSVNEVYDLMKEHKFYIVESIRLPISHSLVGNKGTKLEEVTEIYSHQQALSQCKQYLERKFKNAKIIAVENTAVASRMVKESGRNDIVAISSRECANLYDLKVLQTNVQDSDNNYTRFILIAKDMHFYKGANKISIMTTLPHASGSLHRLLSKFASLNINLTKLESRPIMGSNFEFMFYFDFECDIKDKGVQNLIGELDNMAEQFAFLGAYKERI